MGKAPLGLKDTDVAWVGAWWVGFLIAGFGGLAVVAFGFCFPAQLPNTEHVRRELQLATEVYRADSVKSGTASVTGSLSDASEISIVLAVLCAACVG